MTSPESRSRGCCWALARPDELTAIIDLPSVVSGPVDLIIAFMRSVADVAPISAQVLPRYRRGGALWFAYPKKTGSIKTDISRDNGWELLADRDILPVTQIAIDDNWSALRFRYRDEIKTLTRKADLPGKRPQ